MSDCPKRALKLYRGPMKGTSQQTHGWQVAWKRVKKLKDHPIAKFGPRLITGMGDFTASLRWSS